MSTNIKINVENFYKFNQIAKLYMGNKNENNEVFVSKQNEINKNVISNTNDSKSLNELIESIDPNDIAVVYNDTPKPKSPRPR